jgi:DNA gyrase/topoisomerase IV subunit A
MTTHKSENDKEVNLTVPIKRVASDVIKENTKEYGSYTIDGQFPSPIDGLQKVHRRALWAIYNTPNNENKIPGLTLLSDVLKLHPFGDISTYDAIVRLTQPFKLTNPVIDMIGDCGTYSGDRSASARYSSFRIAQFTKDLFFNGTDKRSYHMVVGEDQKSLEPAHLIPKLPTALLFQNCTPGFGSKSITMSYLLEGVADLVMAYSQHHKRYGISVPWDCTKYIKYLIPHNPICGHLRNYNILKKQMQDGEFDGRVTTDGILNLYPNRVDIVSLPMTASIDRCKLDIYQELGKKSSIFDKNIADYINSSETKLTANLSFKIKKSANYIDTINEIKRAIRFTGHITPTNNYNINGIVAHMNPIQVLKYWYRERYNAILAKKKYRQMSNYAKLQELELKLLVCDEVDEVIKIIRTNDKATGMKLLIDKFKISSHKAHLLMDIPLGTLSSSSKTSLAKQREAILLDNKAIIESYDKIDDEIYTDAKYIKEKYPTKGGLRIPKYKGYICIDNDLIYQYEDDEDLFEMVSRFHKSDIRLDHYKTNDKIFELITNRNTKNYGIIEGYCLPKILKGVGIIHTTTNKNLNTVYRKYGGVGYVNKLIIPEDEDVEVYLTGKDIVTIDKYGKLDRTTVNTLPEKKSICKTLGSDIIYVYDNDNEPRIIASMNTSDTNNLRLQLVTKDTKEIVTTMSGETKILGVYKVNEYPNVYTHLPSTCLSRTKIAFIKITKPLELFKDKDYVIIELTKTTTCKRKIKKINKAQNFIII